jgi:hypothetical protein
MYRSLCAMMYSYVPTSGHPGGSISSGRFVAGIVFDSLDYDASDPDREDADVIFHTYSIRWQEPSSCLRQLAGAPVGYGG